MAGKRAAGTEGTSASTSAPTSGLRGLLVPAVGITLAIVAWGYLVYAAIDFGASARTGNTAGWLLLALASLGATACLFVGLMLISRIVTQLRGSDSPTSGGAATDGAVTDGPETTDLTRATGDVGVTDVGAWLHTRPTGGPAASIVRSASGTTPAPPQSTATRAEPTPALPGPTPRRPEQPTARPEPTPAPAEQPVAPAVKPTPSRGGRRRATEPMKLSRRGRPPGGRRAKR